MRINFALFVKYILGVAILIWAVSIFPLLKFTSSDFLRSFIGGSIISLLNAIVGFWIIKRGIFKPTREFFKLTIGSMGIRLFAIAGIVFALLKIFEFDVIGLVLSLFLFYFAFLVVEIIFLNRLATKGEK